MIPGLSVESGADGELQKSCVPSAMICLNVWRDCRPSLITIASARQKRKTPSNRDYAVSDAARSLLPVVDSFTLALKNSAAKAGKTCARALELIFQAA